MVKIIMF